MDGGRFACGKRMSQWKFSANSVTKRKSYRKKNRPHLHKEYDAWVSWRIGGHPHQNYGKNLNLWYPLPEIQIRRFRHVETTFFDKHWIDWDFSAKLNLWSPQHQENQNHLLPSNLEPQVHLWHEAKFIFRQPLWRKSKDVLFRDDNTK